MTYRLEKDVNESVEALIADYGQEREKRELEYKQGSKGVRNTAVIGQSDEGYYRYSLRSK